MRTNPTIPEIVWDPGIEATHWQPLKEFSGIAMHPDDLRYEAIEDGLRGRETLQRFVKGQT